MESYPRILVGTDGSEDATAAVRVGANIAKHLGVPVDIIASYDGDDDRDYDWADSIATAAELIAREEGATEVKAKAEDGEAADVLVAAATENPKALIVVGSSGLSKASSRLIGSTSNRLSHHSPADVLYVRDPIPKQWNFVALATDGSPTSLRAVRRGIGLAVGLKATPRLVTAAKNEADGQRMIAATLAELAPDERSLDIEHEILVSSQAASAIIAKGWKWEILVIGNKSMSGAARLLGSIANKITHGAETNLLLVNTTRT